MSPTRQTPVWATLALAVTVTAQQQQAGFSLPLNRVPASTSPGVLRLGQTVNNIVVSSSRQYAYTVNACFGTQCFDFCLDTGSADLWVVSTSCHDQDCTAVPQYSPWISPELTQTGDPFVLDYLMGGVRGQIASDTVQMGPYQVESQIFALVDQTAQLGLASTGTSGIMGLCLPATAAIPANIGATLLQNLMSPFDPPQRFFAFHLGRNSGSSDPNASLTMGALDTRFAPDPTFLALSSVLRTGEKYDYWKIPILGMTVNGAPFQVSSSRVPGAATPIAVLDSGTTLCLGPSADVQALYDLLGSAAQYSSTTGYQVRCTYPVLLSVVLGDPPREYPLHPADIAWAEGVDGEWCTGGIQPNDGVNAGDWLLGDCFLRNVYVVHYTDPPAIGLVNLTDPAAARAEFVSMRGPDTLLPVLFSPNKAGRQDNVFAVHTHHTN
ncbi:acid protease [Mycena galericulata]|nr:acid protease [Mycena galericulata]